MDTDKAPEYGAWGVDLSFGDPTVAAGDDFFRYVNGRWLDEYELPADKVSFGTIHALADQSEEQVREIIEELVNSEPAYGSARQKVRDLYLSFMDAQRVNALGLEPVEAYLEELRAISSKDALTRIFGRAGLDGFYTPISWSVGPDARDPDTQTITVGTGALSLPDRDFYLIDEAHFRNIRATFVSHVCQILEFASLDRRNAQAMAADILALETRLATVHWPRTELRDVDKTYNIFRYSELCKNYAGFDWGVYFREGLAQEPARMNVATPSAIQGVIDVLQQTPLSVWRNYLIYKFLVSTSGVLSDDIAETVFDFYGRSLSGQQTPLPRWKRAIGMVSNSLGEALGALYVERYFPSSAKVQMDQLVSNVLRAFSQRIESAPWMGEKTRSMAKRKLAAFRPKIGYPDRWQDYRDLAIDGEDLFGNFRRARRFAHHEMVSRLGKPTDRDRWFMTPQSVNAYYHPVFNEIVFPAAILQAPFFDPAADPAVNYGAIGAVIGHEMGHGFDDQGRKYDHKGVLRSWWAEEDIARFRELTDLLVKQFNSYELRPGSYVNGELTLGENAADLGGLTLGYHGYRLSLDGEEAPVIDGLTGDQRFFLSYGQIWRMKMREQAELASLKSSVHSPPAFRVNGALRNVDAWYAAFDVGPDASLYLPPEERVSIW